MKSLRYIFCAVFVQITTAQVIPYQPPPNTCNPMQTAPTNIPKGVPNAPYNPIPNPPVDIGAPINQDIGAIGADITNPNYGNGIMNPTLAALAGNLASINGNMATFNMGDGGFTVTSGSPNSPGFGIQVLADALEVGGTVAVNGQIPIYGAVAVNGYLPTDGSAAVNYGCGRPAALDSS